MSTEAQKLLAEAMPRDEAWERGMTAEPNPEIVRNARLAEALRHAWKLSGRPDPFESDEAWGGFALALRATLSEMGRETPPWEPFGPVLPSENGEEGSGVTNVAADRLRERLNRLEERLNLRGEYGAADSISFLDAALAAERRNVVAEIRARIEAEDDGSGKGAYNAGIAIHSDYEAAVEALKYLLDANEVPSDAWWANAERIVARLREKVPA